jgi:spermidine/putrescine transport system ATP-binding protein
MVELRDLTKSFGRFDAVRGVNLTIEAGEFMTLLGPSGCGKTTLLRMISGFETPTSGSIFINGVDVTRVPPYSRDVNQVFQSYALFPHLSVEENIAFGLKMKKRPKDEIRERVRKATALVSMEGMECK